MPTPKSILVTGGAGYIGRALRKMAKGSAIEAIPVDIALGKSLFDLKKRDFEGIDLVVHLAAIVGTKACEENPEEALRTNINGTEYLCELAGDIPIVFANTNIGYPSGESDETAELKSDNVYGQTKIEAEKIILNHGGISLRLASVFGISPKMRHDLLIHYLVQQALDGKSSFFDLDSLRNFVHVNDVCHVILRSRGQLKKGQAYNMAIKRHYTKREILGLIYEHIGTRVDLTEEAGQDPDKRDYHLSVEKLYQQFGWYVPNRIEEEIGNLVKYYASVNWKLGKIYATRTVQDNRESGS